MPIYEYSCRACGNDFEKLVSFSSKDIIRCPKCSSENVVKKISMVASGKSGCGGCTSTSCGPS